MPASFFCFWFATGCDVRRNETEGWRGFLLVLLVDDGNAGLLFLDVDDCDEPAATCVVVELEVSTTEGNNDVGLFESDDGDVDAGKRLLLPVNACASDSLL